MDKHIRDTIKAERDRLFNIWQEPPPGFEGLKYRCAAEAFQLVYWLTEGLPSGTHDGVFFNVTSLIYEAITEDGEAELRRQCNAVLAIRKKYMFRMSTPKDRRRVRDRL
jgi:hypothetical protein